MSGLSSLKSARSLAVVLGGLSLMGNAPPHSHHENHAANQAGAAATSAATASAATGDLDGDGYGDTARRAKFKAGKALAETVKRTDAPGDASQAAGDSRPQPGHELKGVGARSAGDPIPGIDITVSSREYDTAARRGGGRDPLKGLNASRCVEKPKTCNK